MTELVQLIRRHEETAVDEQGMKLDRPTPEGVARDYQRGVQIRKQYPLHKIHGAASEKERTYIGLVAMFLGAGVKTDCAIGRLYVLNEGEIPAAIRNDKTRRFTGLFDECRETSMTAGNYLAEYIVSRAENYANATIPQNEVFIGKTHLPSMMAAFLQLTEQPYTLQKAVELELETKMRPGEGFDVKVEKAGRVYGVTITLDQTTHNYELPQLSERISRYVSR